MPPASRCRASSVARSASERARSRSSEWAREAAIDANAARRRASRSRSEGPMRVMFAQGGHSRIIRDGHSRSPLKPPSHAPPLRGAALLCGRACPCGGMVTRRLRVRGRTGGGGRARRRRGSAGTGRAARRTAPGKGSARRRGRETEGGLGQGQAESDHVGDDRGQAVDHRHRPAEGDAPPETPGQEEMKQRAPRGLPHRFERDRARGVVQGQQRSRAAPLAAKKAAESQTPGGVGVDWVTRRRPAGAWGPSEHYT